MLDSSDWPVAFLGALYAGVVPVAVNTLLTADDYAYMLEHSRAQAALRLRAAAADAAGGDGQQAPHELRATDRVAAERALPDRAALSICDHAARARAAAVRRRRLAPTNRAFWLYSSGSTGRPKGTVHTHANLYWTAELYGKPVLGLTERRRLLLRGQAVLRLRPRQRADLPALGRRDGGADGRAADARRHLQALDASSEPTVFFGAPTGYAGMLASPALPAREQVALRLCSSAGEALPGEIGERFNAHFGCDIIDGIGSTEMLHIFLSNRPGDVRYGTTGKPVAGYESSCAARTAGRSRTRRSRRPLHQGPERALMYWGNRAKIARDLPGGVDARAATSTSSTRDGYYIYAGRSDDMLKVSGIYVSPFEVEATLMQHPAVLEAAVIGKSTIATA